MNVNQLSTEILDSYKKLEIWPDGPLPMKLCMLYRTVSEAAETYEQDRKEKRTLLYGYCGINPDDCAFLAECTARGEIPDSTDALTCAPEGLAPRMADIVMEALAIMAELGIDIDAVIMAEHRYNRYKARGEGRAEL